MRERLRSRYLPPLIDMNLAGPNIALLKERLEAQKKAEEEARRAEEEELKRIEEENRIREEEEKAKEEARLKKKEKERVCLINSLETNYEESTY